MLICPSLQIPMIIGKSQLTRLPPRFQGNSWWEVVDAYWCALLRVLELDFFNYEGTFAGCQEMAMLFEGRCEERTRLTHSFIRGWGEEIVL